MPGDTGSVREAQPVAQTAAKVKWAGCPEGTDIPPTQMPLVQCATVKVPLDYSKPKGKKIELTLSRIASTKPEKRRGIMLFNPGGPGGTGLGQAALMVEQGLPASVMDAYDLIGMDTRGVGFSSPVKCGFKADDPYNGNIPPFAVDEAAVAQRAKVVKAAAQTCANSPDAAALKQLTTENMARDLDQIRIALGEKKTSFYGASYGSALGAAYASMFPQRSDRIVLDSNVGDTHLNQEGMRRYGLGFEETFGDFAAWVAARDGAYGLGSTPQEVRENFVSTAERLDETPAPDGTNGALFRHYVFVGAYSPLSYGSRAQYWQSLLDPGTAAPAAQVAADANPLDNALTVFLAVTCNDSEWPSNVKAYQQAVAEDRERYPLFGPASANILPCAYWELGPEKEPVAINDEGPANILILQNQHDPVTPLAGGQLLREKFGQRSRLVTVDGSGHGVYVLGRNACASNVTTSYLISGKLPAKDVACPSD
ncbi:alpha/beta hydrolase [Kineosporia babensis]|uniref:Alpha/beta hydrolase n=1 Tax=Kineosporia babensis TaxID=499548 RepID=A0A9X1NC21_9ACTN|nr:alpha/beta hydrolase [Kineosporia babensis]MCD5310521.1 alpha/beta hydrolase [Kineosporia babensis]